MINRYSFSLDNMCNYLKLNQVFSIDRKVISLRGGATGGMRGITPPIRQRVGNSYLSRQNWIG